MNTVGKEEGPHIPQTEAKLKLRVDHEESVIERNGQTADLETCSGAEISSIVTIVLWVCDLGQSDQHYPPGILLGQKLWSWRSLSPLWSIYIDDRMV